MEKPIFITGIGTDVGKTIVAAALVEKFKTDYWKPVQSGDLANSDTIKVQSLISNTKSVFHPEAYRLTQPFSPHKSADIDRVEIKLDGFVLPQTTNRLIIEGAGGLMVPLNNNDMIIDLIKKLDVDVVLVSRNYLGSINHTLLSIDALTTHGINIKAIVFNGDADSYTEDIIQSKLPKNTTIVRIGHIGSVSKETILNAAGKMVFDEF